MRLVGPLQSALSNYYCDKRNARSGPPPCCLNHRATLKRQTYEVKEKRRETVNLLTRAKEERGSANAIERDAIYRTAANAPVVKCSRHNGVLYARFSSLRFNYRPNVSPEIIIAAAIHLVTSLARVQRNSLLIYSCS